jgi:hypothetical protein
MRRLESKVSAFITGPALARQTLSLPAVICQILFKKKQYCLLPGLFLRATKNSCANRKNN